MNEPPPGWLAEPPPPAGLSAAAAERHARRRADLIYCLIVLLLAAVASSAVWYRTYYNIWPGQAATARVHWCERDYQNDGSPPQTWAQVTAEWQVPVRAFGLYPPLGLPRRHLSAAVFPDAHPSSCATAIYLQTGPDRYQSYSLLGGP
jgi:hypothetical protein